MPKFYRIGDKLYIKMYKDVEQYWEGEEIVAHIRRIMYSVRR